MSSTYPWINEGQIINPSNANATNCLGINSPSGLYLHKQTINSQDKPYYIYSHSYPLYIVNDEYGTSGSASLKYSRIFFDASLSLIELYTEENSGPIGINTSIKIDGIYGTNTITLEAKHYDPVFLTTLDHRMEIKPTGVFLKSNYFSAPTFTIIDNSGAYYTEYTPKQVKFYNPSAGEIVLRQDGVYINGSFGAGWPTICSGGGGGGGVSSITAGANIYLSGPGTGSVIINATGDVTWSQLNNSNSTYNQLGSSNFVFGLTDNGNGGASRTAQYSTTLNVNSNQNGSLGASTSPYLYVGDTYNNKYTLITNVNNVSEPDAINSEVTMATIGTNMCLYADKYSNVGYGQKDFYLYGTTIVPGNNNYAGVNTQLGTVSLPWSSVNSVSFNQVSDKNLKENIEKLDTSYCINLINNINPVSYTFKNNSIHNTQKHFGVIAQEIKEIIGNENLGLHTDGETQAVSYTEFIAPLIKTVQDLLKRVSDLENELSVLKK